MQILVVLIIIASIALGFVVLIQDSKGGGLASNFAGSNQIMGVRKTTDLVEKVTWGLAIAILVLCLSCAFITKNSFDERYGNAVQTEQTTEE
jgi:preprotein translocase subunit SecG